MVDRTIQPLDYQPVQPAPAVPLANATQWCAYCGAALNPMFYFCTTCATPYKPLQSVVPVAYPMPLSEAMLIQRLAPSAWPLFWTFFSVVLGSGIFSALVFRDTRPDLQLLFCSAAVFVTTCIFAAMYWASLTSQFRRIGFDQPAAWVALLALPVLLAINYGYHYWLIHGLNVPTGLSMDRLSEMGLGTGARALLLCLFPAVTEEIAFRGLLQHWLQTALRQERALILAAALFMAMHFSIVSAPYLFAVGLLLGWSKLKTGSLYPSMLIHFLHNFVVIEFMRF